MRYRFYKKHTKSYKKKKKLLGLMTVFLLAIISIVFIPNDTYSKYISTAESSTTIKVAGMEFSLNGSTTSVEVDLGDKIVPGNHGEIPITVNLKSDVAFEVAATIDEELSTLPDNLKFYCDSRYEREVSSCLVTGGYNDEIVDGDYTLYWIWEYTTEDDISEEETLNWSNKDIKVVLNVVAKQVLE